MKFEEEFGVMRREFVVVVVVVDVLCCRWVRC
jgi:hypothetical protein